MKVELMDLLDGKVLKYYYECPACTKWFKELNHLMMHMCYKQDKNHVNWKLAHDITNDDCFQVSKKWLKGCRVDMVE
ncbi:MAG: hypothetical protein FP824_03730 [Euryarchaeota archaeon]|nr:hypothetical protein [Euryarchaeota archaeon]MBU4143311.1 hypothetical protein [Candidatus Thermoplasmatota archaeon]